MNFLGYKNISELEMLLTKPKKSENPNLKIRIISQNKYLKMYVYFDMISKMFEPKINEFK